MLCYVIVYNNMLKLYFFPKHQREWHSIRLVVVRCRELESTHLLYLPTLSVGLSVTAQNTTRKVIHLADARDSVKTYCQEVFT